MTPQQALFLPLIFEAAYLALMMVLGLACHNLRSGAKERRSIVLVVVAAMLAFYAARKLPVGAEAWIVLAPAGLFFLVMGYYAGVGIQAAHRPTMTEQIRELTGESADWEDLRPHRDWHRGRRGD